MISLATFGICLGITVILLILLGLLMGDGFIVPFLLFPMTLAAMVTGNGMGRPRALTNVLSAVFILFLVLLLAGGVYMAYPFLSRALAAGQTVITGWRTSPQSGQVEHLLLVNLLLALSTASLVAERVVNAVGCWSQLRTTNKRVVITRYVQPLCMHVLAFLVLYATRNHLLSQLPGHYAPGYFEIGVLLVYGKHLLSSLFRNLGYCLGLLYYWREFPKRAEDFATVPVLLHTALFSYFLVRVLLAV